MWKQLLGLRTISSLHQQQQQQQQKLSRAIPHIVARVSLGILLAYWNLVLLRQLFLSPPFSFPTRTTTATTQRSSRLEVDQADPAAAVDSSGAVIRNSEWESSSFSSSSGDINSDEGPPIRRSKKEIQEVKERTRKKYRKAKN